MSSLSKNKRWATHALAAFCSMVSLKFHALVNLPGPHNNPSLLDQVTTRSDLEVILVPSVFLNNYISILWLMLWIY